MMKTNYKTLSTAALMITLAACSTSKKTDTSSYGGSTDRTPAQAPQAEMGVQKLVRVFTNTSGATAEVVEQKIVQAMISGKVIPAGTTFQALAGNPTLSKKVTEELIKQIQGKKSIMKVFNITPANSATALKQLREAKDIFANAMIAEKAQGSGDMKSDGAISFFGQDTVKLYNTVPADIKASVKQRITRWASVAKDMPEMKESIDKFVDNGLTFIQKSGGKDWQGPLDCAEWKDFHQEAAIKNGVTVSEDMLKDVAPRRELASYKPALVESIANVTKLSKEVVEKENVPELCGPCGFCNKEFIK
ncbi:MAG: hypothetical protein KA715_07105 [Xanthomonadaceae bacterium]|nr:hypothetical protein [Xanthomonadaceae bacterium]